MTIKEKSLYTSIYKYLDENQIEELDDEDILIINTIELDTREFIKKIGIPINLMGYKFIKESIYIELLKETHYNLKEDDATMNIIAIENNVNKNRIYKNIRYAIEFLKNNKDYSELNKFLGRKVFSRFGMPSNLEFILYSAEKIRDNIKYYTFRN